VGLGLAALAAGGAVVFWHRHPTPPSPAPAPHVAEATPADPLVQARRLLDRDDLDGAGRILDAERARHDGTDLQLLLGEVSLRRGNRLGALAHLHRATRLAPDNAEAHARLASLLRLLGQGEHACREARAALSRDPKSSIAIAAANGCPASPGRTR
jgi:Flp pilus assembly protein TadD